VFEKFFEHSIKLCGQAGLLGEGPVYVDATHVGAAASLASLVTVVYNIRAGLRLTYKAHVTVVGKKGLVVTAALATTGIAG